MARDLVTEVATEQVAPPAPPTGSARPRPTAAIVFALVLLGAFVFYLNLARRMWFYGDDWDFLAARRLGWHDLIRQHGGHLVALPVVVYRALFFVVGIRSYLPYQVLSIGMHLATAFVLFVVMRRAGVRPWLATTAASLFTLFGAGGQDIVWGFQIAFTGALLLPLLQMLLADHDGPVDRRDWFGLLLGLAGLLCSGVALTAIGVAALATLIRRGWRPALLHSAPLYALFLVWYLRYSEEGSIHHSTVRQLARWVRASSAGAFDALGQVPFVGWLIGAMLFVGLVLAWCTGPFARRRRSLSMPTAMLVGAFAFQLVTGMNRSFLGGTRFATSSRYLHIIAALLIPAIAVAAEAIIRRRREFAPVAVALLVVGIPGNLGDTMKTFPPHRYFASYEQMIRSLPRMPLADAVPRSLQPELVNARQMTIGWLRDGARSGRIPAPSRASTAPEVLTNTLRLSLQQVKGGVGTNCVAVQGGPVERVLRDRQYLVVKGTVKVRLVDSATGAVSTPVTYGAFFATGLGPHTLRAVSGDTLTLRFKAAPTAQLCARQS